jgi:hypothetical protein
MVPRPCRGRRGSQAAFSCVATWVEYPSTGHWWRLPSSGMARLATVRELRLTRDLGRALDEHAPNVDVVHNNGLWLIPNVEAGRGAMRPT